jgi:type IV secretion system protein TrbL
MVLYMIIGLGQTLSNTWVHEASQIALSTAGLQSLFGLLASVIVFMALAWQVPKLAGSILQGSLQMGSSDLIAPAMSAAIAAGTIGAVVTAGVGAVAGVAGGGAGAAGGAGEAGGSFMPGGAGGLIPGMGSTMAGGGGSGAAPEVEGAMNSVPPPAASGGGEGVAVDPPPISVAGDGGKSGPGSSAVTGSSATVPTQGNVSVSDSGEAPSSVPDGDRSLGEKISGIHNTAAQAHQHLPQDSATVSAPTLNIQHGE